MRAPLIRAGVVLFAALSLAGCPLSPGDSESDGVKYFGYREARCASSASPLPGFRTCSVVVAVTITKAPSSGVISVYFDYPGSGSFYHGQISVESGFTGSKEITLTNGYVSSCPQIRTDVHVYDAAQITNSTNLISTTSALIGPLC